MESASKEDYLAAIYRLQEKKNSTVKTGELSEILEISKPSVSEMMRKLEKQGMIEFESYKGITLTPKGILTARKVIRKHRILESFFSRIVKLDSEKVHHEAHKLEHSMSDDATEKISQMMEDPNVCPHGQSIPKNIKVARLCDIPAGKNTKILFTRADDKQSLERLNAMGIVPGVDVSIVRKSKKGPNILKVKNSRVALGNELCCTIFVEN